ncbi:probable BOI-related E3 ubiquitin-protein ligase 2 [Phragmites australis]|uniref:probable BOI-related E3 ubiquitin-protein ligase 2 n=1 Tax=Phragmites australis TaxID=29695 RepID=UPI002D78E8E1|nr:probable BOI-related E3 ubiquitin-protein ligase 2 [Phragmites australis]
MAVQAQFGGLAGCLPYPPYGRLGEEQMRALKNYGALLSSAVVAGNDGYQQYQCAGVVSGAQSELTCNGGGGVLASRKRGREAELEQYVSSSSAALLPIPGMQKTMGAASRMVESAMTSTSGRPVAASASVADALVSELCQGAEIDALVRAECERLRAGLEQARKRQCQALVRAAAGAAARRLREKEAELEALRRRVADLEERLRQAAAESQAWCGLARSNEAVAAGLRASLEHLLRAAPAPAEEGFGESDPTTSPAAADGAQSCFEAKDAPVNTAAAATSPVTKWSCKACGEGEASVLLLPCRHLCLCKACEPRLDACPVCFAAKNASIRIAN